jgi:hypothetical protein
VSLFSTLKGEPPTELLKQIKISSAKANPVSENGRI